MSHAQAFSLSRWRKTARASVDLAGLSSLTGTTPLFPVAALLAATGCLPSPAQSITVLAIVVLLGVPHGALDGEIARPLLRPRFGLAWFPVFALPYLGLVACVLIAWRLAPIATLAAFLLASVWHFGSEDAGSNPLEAIARGGLPIALPVLFQPDATVHVLGTVAMLPLHEPPTWLLLGVACWCVAAASWMFRTLRQGRASALVEPGLLALVFAVLPPLTAFAIYFVCLHAPRHMAALVPDPRAPRVGSMGDAVVRSIPITALTLLIGAGLWRWFPGAPDDRLLTLTIEGLAALTLPHMLLDHLSRVTPP